MNFHSDKWIMEQVQRHYEEALQLFPVDRIVGIFLQGSQNYGLDTPSSDIDTKLIVVPTLDDICRNKKAISTTHILANEEHLDLKDLRLMLQTFRKQNLNFIEILFTKYKIINPLYEESWNKLVENNELIARYNPYGAVKTMKGIAMEKYHAMEHPYPSKLAILEQYGYDAKQLHHLARVSEYLIRYIEGVSYADCLISTIPDYLREIKEFHYNLEEARKLADLYKEQVTLDADKFCAENPQNTLEEVDTLLDEVQSEIIKKSIRLELEKEGD